MIRNVIIGSCGFFISVEGSFNNIFAAIIGCPGVFSERHMPPRGVKPWLELLIEISWLQPREALDWTGSLACCSLVAWFELSPSLIFLSLTPNFWSAYAFILIFCSASLSVMLFCLSGVHRWRVGGVNSGKVISFLWLSASHGEKSLFEWGVARYCRKNL